MRFVLPFLAALSLLGCGSPYTATLPDGGRGLVNCDTKALTVPVTVLDREGKPYPGAVVSVEYTSYAQSENLVADGRGIAVVADKYGPGSVRVQGNVNDLRSPVAEITFNGTDCSNYATPRSLTLQVQ